MFSERIFQHHSEASFEELAMEIFQFQARENKVYAEFIHWLGRDPGAVIRLQEIPFMPIEFFKSHDVVSSSSVVQKTFLSSGTTGAHQSRHLVTDLKLYEESFVRGFELFYGPVEQYTILALLPSYLERGGSSLIHMVDNLIQKSGSADSGFYLHDLPGLRNRLLQLDAGKRKVLLLGVSYALLDLLETGRLQLKNTLVMETGGMKGRRREMVKKELHQVLCAGFGVKRIHSEYGMTELLSQAYSRGEGLFETPPWMKVLIREPEDPFAYVVYGKTGGINVIDLANVNSCSFIATQDLGRSYGENSFRVMGRFDQSDIRGCNLMVV